MTCRWRASKTRSKRCLPNLRQWLSFNFSGSARHAKKNKKIFRKCLTGYLHFAIIQSAQGNTTKERLKVTVSRAPITKPSRKRRMSRIAETRSTARLSGKCGKSGREMSTRLTRGRTTRSSGSEKIRPFFMAVSLARFKNSLQAQPDEFCSNSQPANLIDNLSTFLDNVCFPRSERFSE